MPENFIWVYTRGAKNYLTKPAQVLIHKICEAEAAAQRALAADSLELLWIEAFYVKNRYFIAQ